jgi:hypothetical protein
MQDDTNDDVNTQPSNQAQMFGDPQVQEGMIESLDPAIKDENDLDGSEPVDIDAAVRGMGGVGDGDNGPAAIDQAGAIGSQDSDIQNEWQS